MKKTNYRIVFTEREKAVLEAVPLPLPLTGKNVLAKTLYSWVSAGTETTGIYCGAHYSVSYPAYPGYCSLSQVVEVGPEVEDLKPGDIVLGGKHTAWQCLEESQFNRIDPGLDLRNATFIHMFKIPLPALIRSKITAPEKCVVTGLGLVGLCAAQLAQMFGYEVYGYDVNPKRRALAEHYNIPTVDSISEETFGKSVGLGIDCSGHENAVLDLSKIIRRFGELTLVGVPWKRNSDLYAQSILHSVFYNFLTLTSGWECDMPGHPEIFNNRNFELTTMRGMQNGFLRINEGDYELVTPEDPQQIYQNILHNKMSGLGYMIDWRNCE